MLSVLPALVLLAAPSHPPLALPDAEMLLLSALDEGQALPDPKVAPRDRAGLAWLRSVALDEHPRNPFAKGSRGDREVRALEALLREPCPSPEALAALDLAWAGSHLRLWKEGQGRVRQGLWHAGLRRAWEDRLLELDGPAVVRGWALRHALCFALAEGSENRFAALREAWGDALPDLFVDFQRAFGLLGGPAPTLPLWTLPDLTATELVLAERPGIRVRVQPAEGGTLTVPAGADLWIVPSRRGDQSVEDPFLRDAELREGQAIAERFKQAGLKGFLAASRQPFEERALVYFPVELQVDAEGCIASIRMGDAARVQPRPTP
ncbi:MAG: hypothetical protein BWY56_02160 [Acidobacteria bacterium ADurb.Bin340]|nr:MAG: hypothetical protein BWY56_02160 [Acidobacteria bacterium ADurb.Bin340]